MSDERAYEPEKIEASAGSGFRITWSDGHLSAWELDYVRERCGCAECNELRRAGRPVGRHPRSEAAPLDVLDAELVGAYGISIHWNDGHATGIYRWEDLRDGCPCDECRTVRRMDGRPNPLDR